MDRYVAAIALAISIGLTGCNQPSQTTDNTTNPSQENQDAQAKNTAQPANGLGITPDKAVAEFLEAVRMGNDETASLLLTPKAREKTSEANLAVAPPGSPNATYTVGQVEFITASKDAAHVISTWTDQNEDGSKNTDEIIWALRKETEGWRIAGSLMKLKEFPGRPPLVLDFEDPEDMARTKQKYFEEAAKVENQQPGQANAQPQAQVPMATPPVVR